MVRLAVGGHDIDVAEELVHRLGLPRDETPEIRACWTATTTDYSPTLLVELAGGILVVTSPAEAAAGTEVLVVRWDEIAAVGQDRHWWMLLLTTTQGRVLRFLLASLADLHSVASALGARPGAASSAALSEGPSSPAGSSAGRAHPRHTAVPRGRHEPREHSPALDRIEQRLASMELLLAGLTSGAREG